MKVGQFLDTIATQLNDFDPSDASNSYVSWSKSLLASYATDAYCVIAALKPEEFISTRIVKLQPGTTQTTCCTVVGGITEYTDSTGAYISRINPLKMPPTWRGSARTTGHYKPESTYRASGDPTSFDIFPPVPSTGSYYVKIRCSQAPDEINPNDLTADLPPCKYKAAVNEWVMYRALSGDNDSASINLAQLHYKAFNDIMGNLEKVTKAMAINK
jgi:hypothetical protein